MLLPLLDNLLAAPVRATAGQPPPAVRRFVIPRLGRGFDSLRILARAHGRLVARPIALEGSASDRARVTGLARAERRIFGLARVRAQVLERARGGAQGVIFQIRFAGSDAIAWVEAGRLELRAVQVESPPAERTLPIRFMAAGRVRIEGRPAAGQRVRIVPWPKSRASLWRGI